MLDNAGYMELAHLSASSNELVNLLEDIRDKLGDNNDLLCEISEKLSQNTAPYADEKLF